jgi:hypothetical protein
MVMEVGLEDCNGLIKGGDEVFQIQGRRRGVDKGGLLTECQGGKRRNTC